MIFEKAVILRLNHLSYGIEALACFSVLIFYPAENPEPLYIEASLMD